MRVTIACVGKIKEKYFVDAIKEYSKRLSRYITLEIVEVADEKCPETLSDKEAEQVKAAEGDRLLKAIKDGSYVIALAIDGKKYDSVGFSKLFSESMVNGVSHITFVIGGSLGLADKVLKRADSKISFSDMTFPHQLMRVILLEQTYRAYRIIKNEPYHK
jgi:23S rRNA (pseudouridine1915-N3)-methyltransferase